MVEWRTGNSRRIKETYTVAMKVMNFGCCERSREGRWKTYLKQQQPHQQDFTHSR
jgi:hypothetical protein